MDATIKAGVVWLLSASLGAGPAAAAGLPELPDAARLSEALAETPAPPIPSIQDAEPESVCVVPVAQDAEPASSACREGLAAERASVAATEGQDGLVSAIDAVLDGTWPVSEAGCRVVLQKARAAGVLRPMSSDDIAGAVCRDTGLSCVQVRRAGTVTQGCGASAGPEVPVASLAALEWHAQPVPAGARKKEGYNKAFRISEAFAWGGLAFDMTTTARGINAGGTEVGIYRVVGNQNVAGVLLMAAGVEALLTIISRKVYKSGNRKTATVLNLIRGSVHVAAGAHNMGVIRQLSR